MNLSVIFNIRDINNIIFYQLGPNLINLYSVSKQCKLLFIYFINTTIKKVNYSVNIHSFTSLKSIEHENLFLMAKYIYFSKYMIENNNEYMVFLWNNIILQLINNIYVAEKKHIHVEITKLTQIIKNNNNKLIKINNNKFQQNKICTKHTDELKYKNIKYCKISNEIIEHQTHIENNFRSLVVEKLAPFTNYKFLYLVVILQDIKIFELKYTNEKVIGICEELYRYVFYNNTKSDIYKNVVERLKDEITPKQFNDYQNAILKHNSLSKL